MNALSPAEAIDRLRAEGYTDEEIVDQFARFGRMAIRVGEDGQLEWTLGAAGTQHQRRVLADWLTRSRGMSRDDVTGPAVEAERARRMAAGEPSGYDALARHFHCDASTIRRRLGTL